MPDFVHASESTSCEVLNRFLADHGIAKNQDPYLKLRQVAAAFARLPYENLTKIIRDAESGNVVEARRLPGEVLGEHRRWGTGGTCFSLTWTLLHLVRALGFDAQPILADRHYGLDTHCALLVTLNGWPHLLDPGYLLVEPLPLPDKSSVIVPTTFHQVKLTPKGEKIALHTIQQARHVERLQYKVSPVDISTFLRVWDRSFQWDMMTYPVISRIVNGRQFYLQKRHMVIKDRQGAEHLELREDDLVSTVSSRFSIAAEVVAKAVNILHRRREKD